MLLVCNCSSPTEITEVPKVDSLQLTTYSADLASDQFLVHMPFTEGSQLMLEMAYQLAHERTFPQWKEGADFSR